MGRMTAAPPPLPMVDPVIVPSPTEDVTGDVDRPTHFLLEQNLAGVLAGGEEQVGELVGLDPVGLLRHVLPVAAQAGLDVDQRHPGGDRGTGAGDRRVGVAADEDRGGTTVPGPGRARTRRPRGRVSPGTTAG